MLASAIAALSPAVPPGNASRLRDETAGGGTEGSVGRDRKKMAHGETGEPDDDHGRHDGKPHSIAEVPDLARVMLDLIPRRPLCIPLPGCLLQDSCVPDAVVLLEIARLKPWLVRKGPAQGQGDSN